MLNISDCVKKLSTSHQLVGASCGPVAMSYSGKTKV